MNCLASETSITSSIVVVGQNRLSDGTVRTFPRTDSNHKCAVARVVTRSSRGMRDVRIVYVWTGCLCRLRLCDCWCAQALRLLADCCGFAQRGGRRRTLPAALQMRADPALTLPRCNHSQAFKARVAFNDHQSQEDASATCLTLCGSRELDYQLEGPGS